MDDDLVTVKENLRRACGKIQTFLVEGEASLPDDVWQAYLALRQMSLNFGDLAFALEELRHWPANSTCFDGSRARSAVESLANARRRAGDALRKAGVEVA